MSRIAPNILRTFSRTRHKVFTCVMAWEKKVPPPKEDEWIRRGTSLTSFVASRAKKGCSCEGKMVRRHGTFVFCDCLGEEGITNMWLYIDAVYGHGKRPAGRRRQPVRA